MYTDRVDEPSSRTKGDESGIPGSLSWLELASPRTEITHAGLVPIRYRAVFESGTGSGLSANLVVSGGDTHALGEGFEASETVRVWQATLNSLFLPNGTHPVQLRICRDGELLHEHVFTLRVENSGALASGVKAELVAANLAHEIIPGLVDSSNFPYESTKLQPWFNRPDAIDLIPQILKKYGLGSELAPAFENYAKLGFLTLPRHVPEELCNALNAEVEELIASGQIAHEAGSSNRVEHVFQKSAAARKIWTDEKIVRIVQALFDDEPAGCQTLNFLYGSEQSAHQDSIHLSSFPDGYMCGVWVALEDVQTDAGPVILFPGTQRFSGIYCRTLGIEKRLPWFDAELTQKFGTTYKMEMEKLFGLGGHDAQFFTAPAGSVLIWHANLLHGGMPRVNRDLTRRSMVSHYFARGALSYYDSTGTAAARELLGDRVRESAKA